MYYVNVDPKRISHISLLPECTQCFAGPDAFFGAFKGGFDLLKMSFSNHFMYQTVRQILNGEDWKSTPYFEKLCKYKSEIQTLKHYKKLKQLIKILSTDGYLSQYQLMRMDKTELIAKWEVPQHELFVGLDRNGTLFRIKGGRHRLAIAQNIGIQTIPAVLMLYHQSAQNMLPERHRVIKGSINDFRPFK
jgi:hypothetical protein